MTVCERCETEHGVDGARWCDTCASELFDDDPAETVGDGFALWTREDFDALEAELEAEFPEETARVERQLRRVARGIARRRRARDGGAPL